jgi:hypothetical protein
MAYIGQGIKEGTFSVLDTSGNTYNGSNVTFSLGTQVGSPAQLLVSHDGVIQKPGTDYTLATGGTQITFTTAPASGASIFIVEISGAVGGPLDSDLNGTELILDADADTSITADTDDQIDIKVGGTDVATLTNSNLVLKGTTPTVTIGDAGAEDTKIVFDGNAQDFHIGLDDSADDLVIGLGSALGTTTHMAFDETGAITKPLQPSFLVSAATQSNITGDNTDYDLLFTNEIVDRNADYGSSLFTAPITGLYQLSASLYLTGIAANHTSVFVSIVTSNRRQYIVGVDGGATDPADSGEAYFNGSALFDMDANDTAKIQIDVRGGSKVVDIGGGTDAATFFSGALIA